MAVSSWTGCLNGLAARDMVRQKAKSPAGVTLAGLFSLEGSIVVPETP
jgi:hypothetical protein